MAQRESKVETYLRKLVEAKGGACAKFKGSVRGEPDRLVSMPNGFHCLVETKWKAGVAPKAHQVRRHKWWNKRGMKTYVIDCRFDVDWFVENVLHV